MAQFIQNAVPKSIGQNNRNSFVVELYYCSPCNKRSRECNRWRTAWLVSNLTLVKYYR